MSTYNGEKYIEEQLESILSQREVEVYIYIRDDGSLDSTCNIIEQHQAFRKKIFLLKGNNSGVTRSFYKLITYVRSLDKKYDCYAFADQDDFWLPDKLKVAVNVLAKYDETTPNLYYSNLKVVNEHLEYLYDRFPQGYVTNTTKQIMAEVCTYGCSCVFNYCMLDEMSKRADTNDIYHDNWVVWVATFLGRCYYDSDSYILYRQHGKNASGTVKRGTGYLRAQLNRLKKIKEMKPCYEIRAKRFLEIYADDVRLKNEDKENLKWLAYYRNNFRYKLCLLFSKKISSGHIVRECGRKIRILLNVI